MAHKRNVVLYLDSDLVKHSRELGFNLSKTCENHLRCMVKLLEKSNLYSVGSPGEIRTLVSGSRAHHAWPLHHRAFEWLSYLWFDVFCLKSFFTGVRVHND